MLGADASDGRDARWPTYEPLPDAPIVQGYASGVTYVADKVRTTVAIPSDHGDVEAELDVARITDRLRRLARAAGRLDLEPRRRGWKAAALCRA